MSKWFNLDADDYFVKAVNKQLRRDKVRFNKEWYKQFAYIEDWFEGDAVYVTLKHRPSGKLFTTAAICSPEDDFDGNVGLAICANRMARHSDFVEVIKYHVKDSSIAFSYTPLEFFISHTYSL